MRNPGETVLETDGIPGIDWMTGMPLTSPYWAGGPYRLVNDYDPSMEDTVAAVSDAEAEAYVIINGIAYQKV